MAKTFTIDVFQSQDLSDHHDTNSGDPDLALDRMKEYIPKAFDNAIGTNHSANVTDRGIVAIPDGKQNKGDAPRYTGDPCGGSYPVYYETIMDWWEEYYYCNFVIDSSTNEAEDCALLVTNGNGGGLCHDNYYSIAYRGDELDQLPSDYSSLGKNSGFNQMQTQLHEIAHALLDLTASEEHNSGNTYDRGYYYERWFRTPIGHGGSGYHNNYCGDWVDEHTTDELMYFDSCSSGNFKHM